MYCFPETALRGSESFAQKEVSSECELGTLILNSVELIGAFHVDRKRGDFDVAIACMRGKAVPARRSMVP
jgi:hypothetical protein